MLGELSSLLSDHLREQALGMSTPRGHCAIGFHKEPSNPASYAQVQTATIHWWAEENNHPSIYWTKS